MDKKVVYGIVGAAVLFTGLNTYLLMKDDSKAERVAYIPEWSVVAEGTVEKTFPSKGVVRPSEEFNVFYDTDEGPLAEILVEAGDRVEPGTELFTYGTERISGQEEQIVAEINRLNGEIDGVESQIESLESISVESSGENDVRVERNEEDVQVDVDVHVDLSGIAESDVEIAIAEAEADKEKLEAELSALEAEHNRLMDKKSNASVASDVAGEVTDINKDGENPVITIASTALEVQGILTEEQMKQAEVGQEVHLHSVLHGTDYEGTIGKIHSYPDKRPSLEEEAEYPFIVQFNTDIEGDEEGEGVEDAESADSQSDTDERLLPGAKLSMEVVVGRSENVPFIKESSAFSPGKERAVYQLTDKGIVKRKKIETGLTFKGKQEVKKGLEKNDLIVTDPDDVAAGGISFITPLQNKSLETKEMKDLSKKQMAKYVLMGFFEQ